MSKPINNKELFQSVRALIQEVQQQFMKTFYTLAILLFSSSAFAQSVNTKVKDTPIKEEKIEIVNKSFDSLVEKLREKKEDKNSIWDTLIPLLIGAGLTLGTQFAIEFWRIRKEKEKKKQELISRGRAKTYLLAQILKDLAMYKVHKQYYIRAFQLDNDEDSFKKHYEKGQQQRETEAKLDDNIADYLQIVTEYSILTNNFDHFQQHFQSIFNYIHPKSYKFSDCNTETELAVGFEKEELRLNSEYKGLTDIFETIQTAMR
jgi:hypothetical protein